MSRFSERRHDPPQELCATPSGALRCLLDRQEKRGPQRVIRKEIENYAFWLIEDWEK